MAEITWQWFVRQGVDLVGELAQLNESGPKKLDRLRTWVEGTLEQVDDLAAWLPGGWGVMLKSLLDSPIANQFEREWIYWPIAEQIYQQWNTLRNALEADHK